MWLGVFYRTKYKFSPEYKIVHNCAILYFIILIMIGPKILDNSENDQTSPWFERNPMALNKIVLNMWTN